MLLKGIIAAAGRIKDFFIDYYSSMVLLLRGNGDSSGFFDLKSLSDTSDHGLPLTFNGTSRMSSNVKKFGNASFYFDRESNCFISCPDDNDLNLSNTDWTIEAWIYPFGDYSQYNTIITKRNGQTSSCDWQIYLRITTGVLGFYNGVTHESSAVPPAYQWSHVAAIRQGSTIKLFLNGIEVYSVVANAGSGTWPVAIGGLTNNTEKFLGYIDSIRVTKGISRYTSNFTPPQSRFENDSPNVSLLADAQLPDNAVGFLKDSSLSLTEFTMIGNPTSSLDQVKFGNGSLYFNGSTSLSTTNRNLILSSDDYVLEAWIYPTTNTIGTIFNQGNGDSGGAFCFFRNNDQKMGFYANSGTRINSANGTILVPLNEWTHVALVKNQYRYSIFVNGILDQTIDGTIYSHTQGVFKIGNGYGGIVHFNGYMDDIKVTRGTTPIVNLLGLPLPQKEAAKSPDPKILKGIPTNGLILYLGEESDKNFGTQWQDLSGNGYHHYLTDTNFRSSSNATAVNLSSNGRRLRAQENNTFIYGGDHTVIVWAKLLPDGKVSDWRTLLRSSPNDHGILVQNNSNIVGYYDNNTAGFVSYGLNLGTLGLENCWAMYTLVGENAATSKIFINDGSITGNTINYNLVGNKHVEVGAHSTTQPFGDVGQVIVYDRALAQEEIAKIFNTLKDRFGAPSNNDGLVLHLDASNPKSYSGGTIWKDLSETMGGINVRNRSDGWNFQNDPQTGLVSLYNGKNSTYYTAGINIPLKGFNKLQGAIEMWIKPTDLQDGAYGWFVNADGASFTNTENWFWAGVWKGTTSFTFYTRQGRPTNTCCSDDFVITNFENQYKANEWAHFCLTWNIGNGRIYLYKNGSLIASKTNLSTSIQDIFPSEIGQLFNSHGRSTDNGQFKGYCNIYKIYNRELSSTQVLNNYNENKSRFDVYLNDLFIHLDATNYQSYKGFGTLWYNLLGGNANLVNGPTFDSVNGGSITFDGSNDYVTFDDGHAVSLISEFSCFMWVYVQSDGTLLTVLGQSAISTGYHHSAIEVSSAGVLSMGLWQGANALTEKVTTNINFNQWYHVGFTFNGTTLTGYVDGVAFGTTSPFSWAPPSTNMFFALMAASGSNMGTNAYGHGKIGAFYFYKKALSLQEIQDSFNLLDNRKNINGEDDNFILYLDATNSSSYSGSGLWNDLSGNNNNFTLSGPTFVSTSPKHFSFSNGTQQAYNNNAAFMDGLEEFTFNCWVKLDNASLYSTIVSYATSTSFNQFMISYEGNVSPPGLTCFWKENGIRTNYTLTAGLWYNITFVFLASKYIVYVNGEYVGEVNKVGALEGGGYLVFGQEQDALGGGFSTAQEWEGDMSILQFYNRTLTQEEVREKFYKQRRQFDTFGLV